jgi:hypothetical protein
VQRGFLPALMGNFISSGGFSTPFSTELLKTVTSRSQNVFVLKVQRRSSSFCFRPGVKVQLADELGVCTRLNCFGASPYPRMIIFPLSSRSTRHK